jgi:hypothetical protein
MMTEKETFVITKNVTFGMTKNAAVGIAKSIAFNIIISNKHFRYRYLHLQKSPE